MTVLRSANESDATSISRIDAEGLATGHATFREKAHEWTSFDKAYGMERGFSLVVIDRGYVAGWAGVSPTSGRELLSAVVQNTEVQGYWTLGSGPIDFWMAA